MTLAYFSIGAVVIAFVYGLVRDISHWRQASRDMQTPSRFITHRPFDQESD